MEEIGRIIPSIFKKQIRRTEPRLLEILVPLWPRIAGKAIAQHSRPADFESGVLTLTTDCPTWGTQLRQMTEEIRAEINSYLGQPIVKKLRVKKGTEPSFRPPAVASQINSGLAPGLGDGAVDTTAIPDPEVARIMASSYAKYFTRPRR